MILSSTFVPSLGRPSPVTGFFLIFSTLAFTTFIKASLSSGSILLLPFITIAFKFFEPITAPTPDLPAARCLSLITQAIFTSFSPAGPIQATFAPFSPNSSISLSVVA